MSDKRLDLYDASVLVFEEARTFHELTSTTEDIRAHRERLFALAEKLRHEAMKVEPMNEELAASLAETERIAADLASPTWGEDAEASFHDLHRKHLLGRFP